MNTLATGLVDRLFELLLGDLGFAGAEIWEIRHPGAAAPGEREPVYRALRRGGVRDGPPSRRRLLEHGSQPVASLCLWGEPRAGSERAVGPLETLLPWLAMALDHHRMTTLLERQVERQAAQLEDRVRDRTADLRSANQRLVQELEQRRRSLDALIEAARARAAAERLASLGTLAAGIAHEINNPIGSILATAQLAELEAELPPRLGSALEDIVA